MLSLTLSIVLTAAWLSFTVFNVGFRRVMIELKDAIDVDIQTLNPNTATQTHYLREYGKVLSAWIVVAVFTATVSAFAITNIVVWIMSTLDVVTIHHDVLPLGTIVSSLLLATFGVILVASHQMMQTEPLREHLARRLTWYMTKDISNDAQTVQHGSDHSSS